MKKFGIVLAAGKGKRMRSSLYKVLHPVCEKPMVGHVIHCLEQLGLARKIVIVGHGADAVKSYLGNRAEYAFQSEQLGTGHAVIQAGSLLENEAGTTVIVCGDTPLIQERSLQELFEVHEGSGAAATIMTAHMDQPFGYGRIVRDDEDHVVEIVEEKDCSPAQAIICEINSGIYCFDNQKLFSALKDLDNNNAQGEYLLTDVISILRKKAEIIAAYCTEDSNEVLGINDRIALAEAEMVMRDRINKKHLLNGVSIIDPNNSYIGADVVIGEDTTIYPGTVLRGNTQIGQWCEIGPQADLTNVQIANRVQIKYSVLNDASVGDQSTIGPFAYLRPGTVLGKQVKIGDFVELKNAKLDDGSKVSHLSYVGDASVGKDVNIGCGAITVNYDGYNKHMTTIEDGAFVGSNVNLIAPVTIGQGAYVVAGSTITENVPANDLAIARERQVNKSGYAQSLREKLQEKK